VLTSLLLNGLVWVGDKLRNGKVFRLRIDIGIVQSQADGTGLQKDPRAMNNSMI